MLPWGRILSQQMSADFKGCKKESRNGKKGKDWSAKINKLLKSKERWQCDQSVVSDIKLNWIYQLKKSIFVYRMRDQVKN